MVGMVLHAEKVMKAITKSVLHSFYSLYCFFIFFLSPHSSSSKWPVSATLSIMMCCEPSPSPSLTMRYLLSTRDGNSFDYIIITERVMPKLSREKELSTLSQSNGSLILYFFNATYHCHLYRDYDDV